MSSRRSLLLQLPRDILHTVYSEWLSSWQDLSCLDVGCVGKGDRESWLSSLSELKMSEGLDADEEPPEECMSSWYEWVISRKVYLVERFPVRMSVFAGLSAELDYRSYCPSIHSVGIVNDMNGEERSLDLGELSVLEERLYFFVKECSHLEGIRYIASENYKASNDLAFSVLRRGMKANILQSVVIHLLSSNISTSTSSLIRQFLMNQLSSIRELEFIANTISEDYLDEVVSILHEKTTPLTTLHLNTERGISSRRLSGWLSSVAMHLQELDIGMVDRSDFIKGDMLGRAYPQLRSLKLSLHTPCINKFTSEKLLQFYQIYPKLISLYCYNSQKNISIFIMVNDMMGNLCYNMGILQQSRGEKEIILECLYLAIQRSPCKLTVSNQAFCYNLITQYDDWLLFKSKLSPHLTDLVGVMSEPILIEALKDLPRLERLVVHTEGEIFSDLSLTAIMEYGSGLKKLCIYSTNLQHYRFSDEMLSKAIEKCKMLEELNIPGAGYESVLAVKHHLRLKVIHLFHVIISKEDMANILFHERPREDKITWKLQKGQIYGKGYAYKYIVDKRSWQSQRCH